MTKKRKAAAIRYREGEPAPRVLAAGEGRVADAILRLARENGVPLFQDPGLAEALLRLEIGEMIPPALYRAVAEVLAFVYRLDAERLPQPEAGSREPADGAGGEEGQWQKDRN